MKTSTKIAVAGGAILTGVGLYWYCNRLSINVSNINNDRRTLDYIITIGTKKITGSASPNQKQAIREQYKDKTLRILGSGGNHISITISDKNNVTLKSYEYTFPPIGIIPFEGIPTKSHT